MLVLFLRCTGRTSQHWQVGGVAARRSMRKQVPPGSGGTCGSACWRRRSKPKTGFRPPEPARRHRCPAKGVSHTRCADLSLRPRGSRSDCLENPHGDDANGGQGDRSHMGTVLPPGLRRGYLRL